MNIDRIKIKCREKIYLIENTARKTTIETDSNIRTDKGSRPKKLTFLAGISAKAFPPPLGLNGNMSKKVFFFFMYKYQFNENRKNMSNLVV